MARITMTQLGNYGQWGNQVYQYAFIRTYARRRGLEYGVPEWAGQYFFGHQDPPVEARLPRKIESVEPTPHETCFGIPIPPKGDEYADTDFLGWAQYHGAWYAPDRRFIQSLFSPVVSPERERVEPALRTLRKMGRTVISLHLRRGDAGRMIFFLTPLEWCLRWLDAHWRRFESPVLFMSVEDLATVAPFCRYRPVLIENLGIKLRGEPPPKYRYPYEPTIGRVRQMDFFPEWYIMQHSDVMLCAESTFSVSAAWMNSQVREVWRPRLSLRAFEQFDPWNEHVSPREHLDDFPGIPGTSLDANPEYQAEYWKDYKPLHKAVPENMEAIG